MAILENIRKRTTILILIIGLALFAFVVSGVFTNNNGGKIGSSVGEINGEDISIDAFRHKVENASRRYGAQASSMQLVNSVWNQEVRNTILSQQFEDLGIDIQQDQIINFIKMNPSYSQNPQFLDGNGVFNEAKFKEFRATLKSTSPAQFQLWLQDEQAIVQMAKEQVYFDLIKAGVGATLKEGELDYKLANDKIDIKYVRVPYTSIPDSSVNVSKKEIQTYINDHKKDFKQETARNIQFVYFEEKPSAADEKAVKDEIVKLLDDRVEYNSATDSNDTIEGFGKTKDVGVFLDRYSDLKYDTIYKAKRDLPAKFADTLMALQVNQIYGPYLDGNYYKISRMMDKKEGGSVKASHILISYKGAERANPEVTRTKEEAEKKAEELLKEAKKQGTVFAELARENSDDGVSGPRGGDLGYFQEGMMVEGFNDFVFGHKVGDIGLVETNFGYHIIHVDDKQDVVQIATLARELEPSEETTNKLFTDATKFEMDATSSDHAFTDLAKKDGYIVRPVNKIKEMDENLPGLDAQRNIVQWAFKSDTEVGDIKRFNVHNGYAVAQLTAKFKEGLMTVEDASPTVLPIIRKKKKAEQIIAANKGKSMEAFAKDNNVSETSASALTIKNPTIPGAGREPAVVGRAFGLAEGKTSDLIEGESGVFIVAVTKKVDAPKLDNYITYANALHTAEVAKVNTEVYSALRDKAEIEDKRPTFY